MTENSYQSLAGYGEETVIIKKSRFIGQAMPVESEAEASEFIEKIQKQYWDANHNCYAYQIGLHDEYQKANDNNEPAGTAGKPMLEVIKREQLKNVVVVVTRYFGGTLLGAGGLVRAYSQTAAAAIKAAGIVTRSLFQKVQINIDYTWLGKIENETIAAGCFISGIEYTDRVTVKVLVPFAQIENYCQLITNATNGQAVIATGEKLYGAVMDGKLVKLLNE